MSDAPLILIAAGGTGGHMFPAEAFAVEMKSRGWRVGLMSDARGSQYADKFPADWTEEVSAATLGSKRPDKLISSGLKIMSGVKEAKQKLKELKPDVVAGFGGYPAYPALAAAASLDIPIVIHEQNAVLGRVNRRFAKKAKVVACGFDRLDRLPKAAEDRKHVIGNPVRPPILEAGDKPYPQVGVSTVFNLLIIGGSQGARIFGEVIPKAIIDLEPSLRARLKVTQQVRQEQMNDVGDLYSKAGVRAELNPFFKDMADRLAKSHLVIARSGASSVTELQVVGRPAILIPLGIAMDDHQTANAEAMQAAGAADVLAEAAFTSEALTKLLTERLSDGSALAKRAAAAKKLGKRSAASELADLTEAQIAQKASS